MDENLLICWSIYDPAKGPLLVPWNFFLNDYNVTDFHRFHFGWNHFCLKLRLILGTPFTTYSKIVLPETLPLAIVNGPKFPPWQNFLEVEEVE